MKTIASVLILFLAVITLSAQDISGKWKGILSVTDQMGQVMELRINFNISAVENGYVSTLDSPDQDAFEMPVDTTIFKKPELTIKIAEYDVLYVGNLEDASNMKGTLTQFGQEHELNMKKEE